MKENINGKINCMSWENTGKMSTLPKGIYRVNAIPVKISMTFSHRNTKGNPKFEWNQKRPQRAKEILS
jgi:hypothetical protein